MGTVSAAGTAAGTAASAAASAARTAAGAATSTTIATISEQKEINSSNKYQLTFILDIYNTSIGAY